MIRPYLIFLLHNSWLKVVLFWCHRKIKIRNLESWMKAERKYRRMRLYNTLYMNWIKFMVVWSLFCWIAGITFLLYVTFGPSGLLFLVFIGCPASAEVSMVIVTWLCYDAVVAKRAADEAMESLRSRVAPYFQRLTQAEKLEVMKRAQALRPVYIAVWEFAEFTLDVPVNLWDEVINQLLFLLSLWAQSENKHSAGSVLTKTYRIL